MTKAEHTFAIALFPRGSQRLDMWQRLFEPVVTVSVDQQMAKHEHDRMAVGNEDIEKSQVRNKGCKKYELSRFWVQSIFPSCSCSWLNAKRFSVDDGNGNDKAIN